MSTDPLTPPGPGLGLDWMQQFWSAFQAQSPGMSAFAPPMTAEELDRRINDLQSVERWLSFNLSLLQGTIQGLILQRNSLQALQSFTRAFHGTEMGASTGASNDATPPTADANAAAAQWWALMQTQFSQMAQNLMTSAAPATPGARPAEANPDDNHPPAHPKSRRRSDQ